MITTVPAPLATVVRPDWVLVPPNTRVPTPALVKPKPAPLTLPLRVSCPAETVIVRVAVSGVSRFIALVPRLLVILPPRVSGFPHRLQPPLENVSPAFVMEA